VSRLTGVITASGEERNQSLDALCREAPIEELLAECHELDRFRRTSDNLYQRVRALFFLYAIHRFHIPLRPSAGKRALIPFAGYSNLLTRRFEEAIDILAAQSNMDPAPPSPRPRRRLPRARVSTRADQVPQVRRLRNRRWMFPTGNPPSRLASFWRPGWTRAAPILHEATPVRGSDPQRVGDIFSGMDPRALAGHLTDLPRRPSPKLFPRIDQPVFRLVSGICKLPPILLPLPVFDFATTTLTAEGRREEGASAAAGRRRPLADLLTPHGSPAPLLSRQQGQAHLVVACVPPRPSGPPDRRTRATRQIRGLTGGLEEHDRRLVAARAILGEWLGGSGGGWQDSGGVWPGIKLIHGVCAGEGDPEFGISRGRLLPDHKVFTLAEVPQETRDKLQRSLVLVHGGMAQDVGPILEMVTEKYLLRSATEWQGRREAIGILDEVVGHLKNGDIGAVGACTQKNFDGPIQTIFRGPQHLYGHAGGAPALNRRRFLGLLMLGGVRGGMGFLFARAQAGCTAPEQAIMSETKLRWSTPCHSPGARGPVSRSMSAAPEPGCWAAPAPMPANCYALAVPPLLRKGVARFSPPAAPSWPSPPPAALPMSSRAWRTICSITCCRAGEHAAGHANTLTLC
jgi:hypothetical protein